MAALLATGCASPARTLALRDGGKETLTLNGVAHVVSKGPEGEVTLALLTPTYSKATDELPSFSVGYLNTGELSMDFDVTNVAVTGGGRPVRVYTHGEMSERIERAAAQRTAAALASGRQQMGASMQTSGPRPSAAGGTAQIHVPGSFPTTGRFNEPAGSDDPVAALQAQASASASINAQMAASMNSIQAQARLQHARFEDMLRHEVVAPGRMITARIVLHAEDIAAGAPLDITITVGDDVHRFVCETGGG